MEDSFGTAVHGIGHCEVGAATGDFSGVTGSGTSAFHSVGAHLAASYTGVLAP